MKKNDLEFGGYRSVTALAVSSRGFFASLLRRLLIGAFAVSSPAFAGPGTKLFDINFEDFSAIATMGGSCTVGGVACVESSVLVNHAGGKAMAFGATGFPKVSFPVGSGPTQKIKKEKGTIVFDYKPDFSSGDWAGSGAKEQKIFFRLYDPNTTIANYDTLGIGTFYESGKHYIYFRYDTTDSCTPTWDPPAPCRHGVSSINVEPAVVMEWDSSTTHRIVATWDLTSTAAKRLLALSVDGATSWYTELNTPIGVGGFSPSDFFIGSNNGNKSAQGLIDNFEIYDGVAFDVANPVASYISSVHDDGIWQSHETAADSPEAPTLSVSTPFIFFESYPFQPVFEGSLPPTNTDPAEIVMHVARNHQETAFFNIYAGGTDLGVVTTSVSDLVDGASTIDSDTIKVRTVKNWWQAGNDIHRNLSMPVYTPELLVYNDMTNLQCTGSGSAPCTGAAYPSDPAAPFTVTEVKAHTSRQFALTFDIPDTLAAGTYTGTITASSAALGISRTQTLKVVVHDIKLPPIDRTIALYHENQFASNTAENYVEPDLFKKQMKNMRSHGVNGMFFGGQAWSVAEAKLYPSMAASEELTKLGVFRFNVAGYPLDSTDVQKAGYMIEGLNFHGFTPFMYGFDEPEEANGTMLKHLQKSAAIHQCLAPPLAGVCGKVIVAITKELADKINDTTVSSYLGYGVAERKLDLPNLSVESFDATTVDYFSTLLGSDHSVKPNYDELYYWQMHREDPRINRYYTGYHLWLSGLEGVMPYVFQRIAGNPFYDFDTGLANERDLITVYPSEEGGIDTIQWEGFRAGVNDYRFLQAWAELYYELTVCAPDDAYQFAMNLESIVSKYRNRYAFRHESRATFAQDREDLITLIETMQDHIATGLGNSCKHGLTAQYFNDSDTNSSGVITEMDDKLVTPAIPLRIEPKIDFSLASLASPAAGVNADYFSARWTGRVVVPDYTGTYTFCLKGDDGYRLWVNEVDLFENDHWVGQDSVHDCATIDLTAGEVVPIKVEFFDLTEEAILQLTWSWPGQSEVVVPGSALFAE